MSQDWYLIKPPKQQYSGYETDYLNDYGLDTFDELLNTMIGENVAIYNSILTDFEDVRVIVNDKTNNTSLNKYELSLLFPLNTICKAGMYVQYKNDYWLVTSYTNNNLVYQKVIMQLCNYTLKFQSPTGTILSYPCIDDSSIMTGIDENNTISMLNGVHRIKLPFDENTKLIGVDRRFFLDKAGTTTYKVTNVNNTTYNYGDKGLIKLTLQQDILQINDGELPKDRPDLGICNYFEPTVNPEPTPSPTGYTLTISSSGDFNLGTIRTLTPVLKDGDGNIMSDWTAEWTIDYNGMDESYFTVTYEKNQCRVAVSDDAYNCVDGVLNITCSCVVGEETVSTTYSGTIIV